MRNNTNDDDLEILQNDLEAVERGLNERRGILFLAQGNIMDRSSGASSPSSQQQHHQHHHNHRGGRALFDSIGSALGNIRGRLHELADSITAPAPDDPTNNASSSSSAAAAANVARPAVLSREESLRVLSQRLDTAELSHSTRMPLNLLQSELSRRDDLSNSNLNLNSNETETENETHAEDATSPTTDDERQAFLSPPQRRTQMRRQSSALWASRNRDDLSDDVSAIQGQAPSIGGSSIGQSPSASVLASSSSSPVANNLSELSFASGRDLVASARTSSGSSATLPTHQERLSIKEDGVEISIEEDGQHDDRELLLPDSAKKHKQHLRPSMRGSMKILGEDVVRQLAVDLGTPKDDVETPAAPPSTTTPDVEIYTWGSLEFSMNSDGDGNKEGTMDDAAYQLFGTCENNGKHAAADSPRPLPSDTRLGRADIVSMSASKTHCAFVTASGRLLICGNNRTGAVDPSRRESFCIPRPTHLEAGLGMNRIKKVSCGINHTAVVTETKSVLTWGCNGKGQLGHRNAKRSSGPAASFVFPKAFILGNGGRRADNVACCDGYTVVLTTRMEAYVCGGESLAAPKGCPSSSVVFNDDDEDAFFPMPQQNSVLRGLPLVGITSGLRHLVAWTAHGTAYAWGCNEAGQCGREYPRELKVPVPIGVPKSTFTPIMAANNKSHSTISSSSFLKNWDVWARGEPMSLASDVHVVDAACGKDHTVLVTDSGRLLVCGSNTSGQLGVVVEFKSDTLPASMISFKVQPVDHPSPKRRFQCVEAGTNHTLLLDDSGSVWQMENGEASIRPIPSLLLPGSQICSIATGGSINFAVSKSKSTESLCATMPSAPELDDLMNAIRSEHEQKNEWNAPSTTKTSLQQAEMNSTNYLSSIEDLARGTENLFRSPAVMNSLSVDPKEIDHMYQTLIHGSHTSEMKQRIVSSIARGMRAGLKSMEDSRLIYFESVRFLLLYLQCPLWRDEEQNSKNEDEKESRITFDSRGDLLFLLCETILGLPFEGYKAFLAWGAAVYGEKLFVPLLVKPLVQQLNYRFMNNITHGIPMVAGVLRWLHTVNERSDHALARGQDFYCTGIDDMSTEALFEDLTTYQTATHVQRSSNFFLAAHPFLMAPAIKQKLLQVENQMSMVEAAQADGVSFDAQTREFKFQPYFVLSIDRKYLLQQTLQAVAKASTEKLRKGLKVVFKGEDGVDAGGVTKEFFQLLCEKLFDVNTGMWTTSFGNHNKTWFNSDCTWNGDGFYLVGVLCGLAVYNSVILDVHFPHAIYRKLLGLPLGLEDLIDEDVRKGLKSLLDYDGDDAEDVFCLSFEVAWMDLGQERKKELKAGGSDIAVTSENKEEYVRLYVKWLLVDSIASQYDEFERGFNQVMEDSSLDILLAEELELLVTGTPELDFLALEGSSEYEGGFDKDSAVVQNIWKWIQSASLPTQEQFLKFCTGSSKGEFLGRDDQFNSSGIAFLLFVVSLINPFVFFLIFSRQDPSVDSAKCRSRSKGTLNWIHIKFLG
jgi:alpha-tubulin suppressor-like RCC1 family protein